MISFWYSVHMLVESHNAVSGTCMLCASLFLSSPIFMHNIFKIRTLLAEERAETALINTSVVMEFQSLKRELIISIPQTSTFPSGNIFLASLRTTCSSHSYFLLHL